MTLNEILNDENYQLLFEQYINENDIVNVISELSELENYDINKLFFAYRQIFLKNNMYGEHISRNLIYRHKLSLNELMSWLLFTNDYSAKYWENIYCEVASDKKLCWTIIFSELSNFDIRHKEFIQQLFSEIIGDYSFEYIKDVIFDFEDLISICKKLSCFIDMYPQKLFSLYEDVVNVRKFSEKDISVMLSFFLFNYPYVAKTYVENESTNKESIFYNFVEQYVKQFIVNQDKINNCLDLRGYNSRLIQYEKRKNKYQQEINKLSREKSIFYELTSHNTIMYGNDIAFMMSDDTLRFSKFQKFESSYMLPLGFVIDPIKYAIDVDNILNEKVGDVL